MKERIKKIVEPILGYGLIAVVILIIISVIAIFGGAIMHIFGFEYQSVGSIVLFFIIIAVIGFPVEVFVKALPKALVSIGKISTKTGKIVFILLDTIGTSLVMICVDYLMDSVSASILAIFIISFVMAVASLEKEK